MTTAVESLVGAASIQERAKEAALELAPLPIGDFCAGDEQELYARIAATWADGIEALSLTDQESGALALDIFRLYTLVITG